ncbi:MAG: DUF1846 family protein [Eggerthellaceae bacterium]|nr:DUF1846 family protein [Eggerthellaceae bacterium]
MTPSHPLKVVCEAATIVFNDVNTIDSFHLEN